MRTGGCTELPERTGRGSRPAYATHCRTVSSGSSVHPPVRISKRGNGYLRRALFMPALVAVRHNTAVQRLATELAAKGKAPLQVLVAVMRKLLHAIYGMLKTDTDFDGEKFRRSVAIAA